ncbi:methyltransferase domain-containing protein [Tuwongella immobilis]|uniref:Methyltransferase domain-containing protein n=1 Tax=Tuwongella immobilis TaxID=692036 RepID=A0A6C2YXT5_9BACT|nr:methyltransferase domain-containing protein [Tuwongella immobilis]VIP05612.1 Methyltransferase family protein OS=Cyanobium gracile (strain ATCC 27147 / PCC 6307) GN=Cyagr_0504 PE=4 SV=1: Methyltransf_23 [Tuwongella immobilis]VTS08580.1 Methyltransferase family protein OS=Cyanobium gracile (strain ATCC 27147 / PCC 6307) GN=Cyagr_0504 PE=4 SV=1: Methyltransf_23 [Tuwongella immobilis]
MLAWPDLQRRDRQPEWMDQPDLAPELHTAALRGLARLNAVSGAVGMLWRPLRQLAQRLNRPLRILDLAAGGCDTLLALAHRAKRAGYSWHWAACDRSPQARNLALEQAARAGIALEYHTQDLLTQPLPTGYDVLTCSLFLHHLNESEIITLLQHASEAAGEMLLVNDLIRSRLSYALVWLGCRLLTRSPVVHVDGPLSIRAAFTVAEWRQLAERAGLAPVQQSIGWPARMQLQWNRPHDG